LLTLFPEDDFGQFDLICSHFVRTRLQANKKRTSGTHEQPARGNGRLSKGVK
jgi:hypothetical protein